MNLWSDFINHGTQVKKLAHYFPIYEKYLSQYVNKPVKVLEIGVAKGGSLNLWRNFFGPWSTIVGIDIHKPKTESYDEGIFFRQGDQGDVKFLSQLLEEFESFDVVIDDGSHKMPQLRISFDFLFPNLNNHGTYIVEDVMTSYWAKYGGGLDRNDTFIAFTKELIDSLHHCYIDQKHELQPHGSSLLGIHVHDGVVIFEKGSIPRRSLYKLGQRNLDVIKRISQFDLDSSYGETFEEK